MKRYYTSIILSLLIVNFSFAGGNGITFDNADFKTLLAKSKSERKLLMIKCYASWCEACKWMAANTLSNDTVGEFYNSNFICAKIDMENGEGLTIAKTYSVSAYPTFLFLNGDGKMVHRVAGGAYPQSFIQYGKDAMNPETQLASLIKKYEGGERKSDFLLNYVRNISSAYLPYEDVLQEYFKTQPESELTSEGNWQLILDLVYDYKSPQFNYVLKNKQKFTEKYTEEAVNEKIKNVYTESLWACIQKKDDKGYAEIKSTIEKLNDPNREYIIFSSDLQYYFAKKDWDNYAKQAALYTDKYFGANPNILNEIAWNFYENIDDKNLLAKAETWAKKSIEIKDGYANHDTYAAVLCKLGKYTDAKQAAEDAIILAKKEGQDFTGTIALLDKINIQLNNGGSH